MYYGLEEVPIESGTHDRYITIHREEEHVFRPETIASFIGKPVTNDHPPEHVDPANFKQYVEGIIADAYRGTGVWDKYIMADLLIMGADAIKNVREGKREVSAGYNAEYEQLSPGHGRQLNIIGNHVALVDRGRCGPSCAIGDRRTNMATDKKKTWFDSLRNAFHAKDAVEFETLLKEQTNDSAASGGVVLNIHTSETADKAKAPTADQETQDRLARIEAALEKLATKDSKKKTKDKTKDAEEEEETDDSDEDETDDSDEEEETNDAASHFRMFQDTASRAELITPGFRMPTFDSQEKSTKRVKDTLCSAKRKVLDKAYESEQGKRFIDPLLNGKKASFDKMPCQVLDAMFISVSEMYRVANTARHQQKATVNDGQPDPFRRGGLDKINQGFWKDRK
jgi:hypothetical protein